MQKITTQKFKKFFKWLALIGLTIFTITLSGGIWFVHQQLSTLPNIDKQYLKTYGVSQITDSQNNVIWKSTQKRVESVTYDDVDDLLYTKSLIAVEDKNFWKNKGVSLKEIFVVLLGQVRQKIQKGYVARGASTIEQQLIKNKYFNRGQGISTTTRKIQEWFLARQSSKNLTKKEILTAYLNDLEFSEGDQGIAAIMKTYFGKSPKDFQNRTAANIAEQAYLAGLGQAPSAYNLYDHPEAATKRKNIVLNVMLRSKLITKKEYNEAKAFDLTSELKPRYWESQEQQQQNLKYKVYTDEVINEVKSLGYNLDDITLNIKTFLNQETFDSITNKVRERAYYQDDNDEQVAATVIDTNGIVIGMVGSRHENDELNRAIQQTRSSGSSTKPFTAYGPLLQYFGDQYTSGSTFDTSNYVYPGTNSVMYNYGQYNYGIKSIQYALRMSLNTVVGRIDDQILGSARMKTFLHNVNLDVKDTYSSVDGIGLNISTLQEAAAYNAINNGGVYIKPRFIDEIKFTDGSIKKIEAEKTQAMNPSTAWVLSQMLRGTVTSPYSAQSAAIGNYVGYAGKTGSVALDPSSQSPNVYGYGGSDSWFASITNGGYSISLWFGYDEPNTSPQVADEFDGPQYLGRDLQLMLNANNQNVYSNWSRPENVKDIGGSGIEATYGITDSADIDTNVSSVSVTDISGLKIPTISTITPETSVSKTWNENMGNNQKLYDLFKSNNNILSNTDILPNSIFQLLP